MLDIKFIRENQSLVQAAAAKKKINIDLAELLQRDLERIRLGAEVDALRAKQNAASSEISQGGGKKEELIAKMKTVKETLQEKEEALRSTLRTWQELMLQVPNIPDMSVPEGESEADNKEIRTWGEKPSFSFNPKDHIELMTARGLADFERGTKIAGFRGYVLKGLGAILSFGLWRLALDHLIKKGFTPMVVPSKVKKESLLGTGYLPNGEDDLFKTQDGDYLAGTSEVGTMGYFMDEVLNKAELPVKIAAFSPCFRREAGSHGKDTKGLIRVHEFFKVEQLVLCEASHEESVAWHEALTSNAEEILQALNLPYRVIVLCGGDMGKPHVKTYDLEVWLPSEDRYRETHSSSYYHDFQTRRLNIRYRDGEENLRFVHSLNNTGIATPRIIAALVENYQQEDGSILLPKALASYIGTDRL